MCAVYLQWRVLTRLGEGVTVKRLLRGFHSQPVETNGDLDWTRYASGENDWNGFWRVLEEESPEFPGSSDVARRKEEPRKTCYLARKCWCMLVEAEKRSGRKGTLNLYQGFCLGGRLGLSKVKGRGFNFMFYKSQEYDLCCTSILYPKNRAFHVGFLCCSVFCK